jgi:hypothetical protein
MIAIKASLAVAAAAVIVVLYALATTADIAAEHAF